MYNSTAMKFILRVALTALLSYIIEQWLPSWSIMICAGIVSMYIRTNSATAFLDGFVAISLLWMSQASVIDVRTNSILSAKIAPLLGFQSPVVLILLTGLAGGMLGGVGGMSGHQLYMFIHKKEEKFDLE